MHEISLIEGGPVSPALVLPDVCVTALIETGLVDVRPVGHERVVLVPLRNKVGAVRVGALQIEVRPKESVKLTHLLFLLGYAEAGAFRPDDVHAIEDGALWPALGYSLAQAAERALQRGVLQGYRTHDDALRTVRGRIRMGDQIARRPGRMVPIEVSYDEYTIDIAENRILLAAVRRMLAVPGLPTDVRARLRRSAASLDGVLPLRGGEPLPAWRPSRLNTRYQPALRLSEIVLRHAAVKPDAHGGVEMAAFVLPMWETFETFVTAALRDALASARGHTSPQARGYLDTRHEGSAPADWRSRGRVALRPDVVHVGPGGRPLAVFDAKYKASPDGTPFPNADIYQMHAYATAMRLRHAWLIYAGGPADGDESIRIKNTDITVWRCPLDLAAHPHDILARIAAIARRAMTAEELDATA